MNAPKRTIGAYLPIAAAALALTACGGGTSTVEVGDPGAIAALEAERDAARGEVEQLRSLLRGPASEAGRETALTGAKTGIDAAREAVVRTNDALAAAPDDAPETRKALTATADALRLAGDALQAALGSATANTMHGTPLENAQDALTAARAAIARAREADEGADDALARADEAVVAARGALAPLTVDRLTELRAQLAGVTAELERAGVELAAANAATAAGTRRADDAEAAAAAEKRRADAAKAATAAETNARLAAEAETRRAEADTAEEKRRADRAEAATVEEKRRADRAEARAEAERAWRGPMNDAWNALTGAQAATAQARDGLDTAEAALAAALADLDDRLDASGAAEAAARTDADRTAARAAVREALDARDAARAARDTARTALRTAEGMERMAAAAFGTTARAALARAETEALRAEAQAQVNAATRAVATAPAEPPSAWAAGDPLTPAAPRFAPVGEVTIDRAPRADTGEDDWEKLAIATDGVPWAEGETVLSTAGDGATDELPLRAVTLRAAGRHPIRIQGDDGTPAAYSNTDGVVESSLQLSADGLTLKFGGTGVIYYDNQIRFDIGANKDSWASVGPDGKAGDKDADTGDAMTAAHAADLGLAAASGNLTAAQATELAGYALDNPSAHGADRKKGDATAAAGDAMTVAHAADLGLTEPSGNLDADQAAMLVGWAADNPATGGCWQQDLSLCGDWNHDDLAVAFGRPSRSPDGEPAHYWKARIPLSDTQAVQRLPDRMRAGAPTADGRSKTLGSYELWLSNYAGLDTGADADDASDDSHRYLEYAAYGLSMVFDNVKATPSFSRPQAFAVGYDAFGNADGMKTTDLATSIAATFEGRTMARALTNNDDSNFITLDGAISVRGDIALNACIGGAGCSGDGIPSGANKISGNISGLEQLRHDGVWIPYKDASRGIPMHEGDIAADGSFTGLLGYPRILNSQGDEEANSYPFDANDPPGAENYPASRYAGNLYGPRDGALEAAGWWHVRNDSRVRANLSSLFGSFGAVCVSGCE